MKRLPYKTRKKDLLVKKSGLPAAGNGLFTRLAIKKGELIVEYTGRVRTWKEILDSRDAFNGYVYYINRQRVVDAMLHKKALGRYANDARGPGKSRGLRNNAQYVELGKRVFIRSTRPIPAGAEILVSYGREYWASVRHNQRLKD